MVAAARALLPRRVERQIIRLEGVTRAIVKIPDYQVQLAPRSPWHRRGGIEGETACGEPVDEGMLTLRSYILDGTLCDRGCFSPHELRLGGANGQRTTTVPMSFDTSDIDDDD